MYGKLLESGVAPYNFEPNAEESFFVKLARKGEEKIMWSLGLKDAIENSNITIGDTVSFKFDRKETVILKGGKISHRSFFTATKIDVNSHASQRPEFYSHSDAAFLNSKKNNSYSAYGSTPSQTRRLTKGQETRVKRYVIAAILIGFWILAGLNK